MEAKGRHSWFVQVYRAKHKFRYTNMISIQEPCLVFLLHLRDRLRFEDVDRFVSCYHAGHCGYHLLLLFLLFVVPRIWTATRILALSMDRWICG